MNQANATQTQVHPLKFMPKDAEAHIASMVIQCLPEHLSNITDQCRSKAACTVYTDDNNSTFVLVLETTTEHLITEAINDLNVMTGVINVSLVYHHCDSVQSLEQEMS